ASLIPRGLRGRSGCHGERHVAVLDLVRRDRQDTHDHDISGVLSRSLVTALVAAGGCRRSVRRHCDRYVAIAQSRQRATHRQCEVAVVNGCQGRRLFEVDTCGIDHSGSYTQQDRCSHQYLSYMSRYMSLKAFHYCFFRFSCFVLLDGIPSGVAQGIPSKLLRESLPVLLRESLPVRKSTSSLYCPPNPRQSGKAWKPYQGKP